MNKCELCGVFTILTKHHLIPQSKIKNKYRELKENSDNLLWICRSCHDQIHALFSNNELRDFLNTKELLLSNSKLQKYIKWKIKHPTFDGHSKLSNQQKYYD